MGIDISFLNVTATLALVLMVLVTGGIVYLTAVEWSDRRRQERDKRGR
ncbi:MAG: hypothetical protein AAFR31_09725 [Cyanobacteria bacterium J06627_8]